jgi:DNA-binding Lrp family transcriptional regulator
MMVAFLLVNIGVGAEDSVVDEMKKIANVKEAYITYGAYDIVARVEAESLEQLKELVTTKIKRVRNVRAILALLAAES